MHMRFWLLPLGVSLMAVLGLWGNHHLAACTTADRAPADFIPFLTRFNLNLTLLSGMAILAAVWLWVPSVRASLEAVLQGRRGSLVLGGITLLGYLGGLVALFIFAQLENPCTESLIWMLFGWGILWAGCLGLLYPRLGGRVVLSGFSLLLTLLMLEGGLRLTMRLNPFVLPRTIRPHPVVGWTMVPESEFTWMGFYPTCVSFRTEAFANSYGHYDVEHDLTKPADTIRIMALGDSFFQAMEVPFEERSTRLLQAQLEQNPPPYQTWAGVSPHYEVLNFGVQGFSTGQSWLVYQEYARDFDPDYVFLLVSEVIISRIQDPYFGPNEPLILRPTFFLNSGNVTQLPPADYETAIGIYNDSFDPQTGMPRTKPIYLQNPNIFTPPKVWLEQPYLALQQHSQFAMFLQPRLEAFWVQFYQQVLGIPNQARPRFFTDDQLNTQVAVMYALGRDVAADGGKLIILDDVANPEIGDRLAGISREQNWGYVRLYDALAETVRQGEPIHFLCDPHYNATGNRVMGEVMYDALVADLMTPERIGGDEHLSIFDQKNGEWHIYRIVEGQGVFMVAVRPSELTDTPLILTADDGWAVRLQEIAEGYEIQLFDPLEAAQNNPLTIQGAN